MGPREKPSLQGEGQLRRIFIWITDWLVRRLHRRYETVREYHCPACGFSSRDTVRLTTIK